jgi:hypothetical protein
MRKESDLQQQKIIEEIKKDLKVQIMNMLNKLKNIVLEYLNQTII